MSIYTYMFCCHIRLIHHDDDHSCEHPSHYANMPLKTSPCRYSARCPARSVLCRCRSSDPDTDRISCMYNAYVTKSDNEIYGNENSKPKRMSNSNKKLIRRSDSERERCIRRHRTRSTKYNRLVHKFRHRSTRLCRYCW